MIEAMTRRGFLGGLAGTLALTHDLAAIEQQLRLAGAVAQQQEYWRILRDTFVMPADRIHLNVATLGPSPRSVIDAVIDHARAVAETFPPAADWTALKARLGSLLNADPDGFVFPRNTTEAMNFVANGIDFSAGDEILTTDHEHIGGLCCWQRTARRYALTLRQLPLPAEPGDIVQLFRDAITPRTRVISISHVNFTNGLVMPVRDIVQLCRAHDIISVIDGAHPPGMMPVDLADIQPDFYASSPHKWLLAVQGTGLLWITEAWRTRLWPTLASGGWDDLTLGAHRFNHLGTLDESRLAGLLEALRFHELIGPDRVYARIRSLRLRLVEGLARMPRIRITSPPNDNAAGMVAFAIQGLDALELQRRLSETDAPAGSPLAGQRLRVRTRVIGEYGHGWMRLAPHIYNSEDEIDTVLDLIAANL